MARDGSARCSIRKNNQKTPNSGTPAPAGGLSRLFSVTISPTLIYKKTFTSVIVLKVCNREIRLSNISKPMLPYLCFFIYNTKIPLGIHNQEFSSILQFFILIQ